VAKTNEISRKNRPHNCVNYDFKNKPKNRPCVPPIRKAHSFAEEIESADVGESGGSGGLFSVVAMNDADDFFLFFGGNSDGIQCFTSSAIRTNLGVVSS